VLREKAVVGHHQLLVALFRALEAAGFTELDEIFGAIDLRGSNGQRVLFEAKTLTGNNESKQVRGGTAQCQRTRLIETRADARIASSRTTSLSRPGREASTASLLIVTTSRRFSG